MNVDKLAQQIETVGWRVDKLHGRAGELPLQQQELLAEAFEELETALEQLHLAEEELHQQNENLAVAREAVEEERQRYQDLFEFAPDGYLVTDAEGTIREANRAAARLLNLSQDFLVGKPLIIFVAESERRVFHSELTRLHQLNRLPEWAIRLSPRNGANFDAALTVTAVRNRQGKPIALRWLLRDITERKQAEEALRQQTERARLLKVMCDRIRQSLDLGEILNTTVAEVRQFLACDRVLIYRFQPDWSGVVVVESVGLGWTPILATTIRDTHFEEAYVPYRQGHIDATEDIYTSSLDQSHINLLAQFQVRANLVVPILQARNQHSTLSTQESEKFLDSSPNTQPCFEQSERTPTTGTEEARTGQRILPTVIEGQNSLSALSLPNTQLWGLLIAHHCAAPRQWQPFEIDLLSSLATQLAIAIQQAQLYQQLSTLNTDLERQVQERTVELQQKIKELQELNILKNDFLSTVSHELRTPLANMKMAIEMLKVAPSPERQQRYLEICEAECNREADLINNLLDLQRLEAEFYPISLREVVNLQDWLPSIVEPFHSRVQESQQTLQVDLPPDLPPLILDSAGLGRILVELLNNACKYTPAGGEILLRIRYHSESPVLTFIISNQAKISAAALSRIFEKFYRVPHADPWKQGGIGLGLALVQKLVEQLGGTIRVESSGDWTTFTVQLPA